MIKLVAADMDGTLLNSKHELPARLFPVVNALKERGVRFAVASGRSYINVRHKLGPEAEDFLYLCENGACVYDHGECLSAVGMQLEQAVGLVEKIRQIPWAHIILCCVNGAYMEPSAQGEVLRQIREYYDFMEIVPDALEAAGKDTLCKATIFAEGDAETTLCPLLSGFDSTLHMVLSGEHWVDFNNPEVNKGAALRRLETMMGIAPDEIMAFGDQLNDLEMLQCCAYSYAMENAHEEVKKAARFRTKSNDEDGVMEAIVRVFHLEGVIT